MAVYFYTTHGMPIEIFNQKIKEMNLLQIAWLCKDFV